MALTGLPLLLVCLLATALAVGLTISGWRRGGRARIAVRAGGILLCEVVALFTVGVGVNRTLALYPSWSTLVHPVPPPAVNAVGPAAALDGSVLQRLRRAGGRGVLITWRPAGWTGWGLAGPPSVYLPPAYGTGTGLRFPVVVVLAPPGTSTPPGGSPAIVVFLRAPAGTPGLVGVLDFDLPAALGIDLRVAPHGWAVVAVGAEAPVAVTWSHRPAGPYQLAVPAGSAGVKAALDGVYALLPAPLKPPLTGPVGVPPKPRPHSSESAGTSGHRAGRA